MSNVHLRSELGFLFTLILGVGFAACGGKDEGSGGGTAGSGGSQATGGVATPGGVSTTGGVAGTGATPATGGTQPTTGGTTPGGTGGGGATTGGTQPTTGGTATTGGATSGGSAGAPAAIEGYSVEEGGYVRTCGMQGYAWTAAGPAEPNNDTGSISTIAPADFTAVAAGDTLCASGVVAEDADYGGYAMIGVNIGQEVSQVEGEETPNVNITPTGTGITVSVTNNGGSALRIQIQDDLGATDAAHRWCANLPASGQATIEWGEFNTECWAPAGGTYYANEPINAVLVLVPGKNSADTPFDFCLNGFTQAGTTDCGTTGQGGAGGAGPATGGAGGAAPETGGAGGAVAGGAGPEAGAPAVAGAAGSAVVVGGASNLAGAPSAGSGSDPAAGRPGGV